MFAMSLGWGWTGTAVTQAASVSDQEQQFLRQAASTGLADVQLGHLALARATTPEVQRLGQQMVTDATHIQQALMAVAQAKQIPLPTTLDVEQQQMVTALARQEGARFDSASMRHMLLERTTAVQRFALVAQEGHDPAITACARTTLATVQAHLQQAQPWTP
jgi:putative membrane protein